MKKQMVETDNSMAMNNEYRMAMYMALDMDENLFEMVNKRLSALNGLDTLNVDELRHVCQSKSAKIKRDISRFCLKKFGKALSKINKPQLIMTIAHFDFQDENLNHVRSDVNRKKCLKNIKKRKITYSEDMSNFQFEYVSGIMFTISRNHVYDHQCVLLINEGIVLIMDMISRARKLMDIQDFVSKHVLSSSK